MERAGLAKSLPPSVDVVLKGDMSNVLQMYPDDFFDSVVTDPPYGLGKEPDMEQVLYHWLRGEDFDPGGGGFMGKKWDSFVPGPNAWRQLYRVLKPGGLMFVFAGTRTVDLMALSLRIAGFQRLDIYQWVYGSGFPKSYNISRAIEKLLNKERVSAGVECIKSGGAEATRRWEGWGTGLKPAYEPILLVRKPIFKNTVAMKVLRCGGNLVIDGKHMKCISRDKLEKCEFGSELTAHLLSSVVSISEKHDVEDRVSTPELLPGHPHFIYMAKASRKERSMDGRIENNHPTVKPLGLMRKLVGMITPEGGVVLDSFCGSGTTLLGAVMEGRRYVGIDIDLDGAWTELAKGRLRLLKEDLALSVENARLF